MLRCNYNNALAQAWNLRLQLRIGSGGSKLTTKTVYPTTLAPLEVLDFEQLIISNRQVSSMVGNLSDQLQIAVQGYNTSLSKQLVLYDLILIPVDEWALDAIVPETQSTGSPQVVTYNYLDIDSIGILKVVSQLPIEMQPDLSWLNIRQLIMGQSFCKKMYRNDIGS
jgi:formylmethanofuran dehydrogenase subunit D